MNTIEEVPAARRYPEPIECRRARAKLLKPAGSVVLDEMIALYRKMANEKPVAITPRQLSKARNMARMTAYRAIQDLVDHGFVVVASPGSYDEKRIPTRYRLTMFPCDGKDATHDYIVDVRAWRRASRNKRPDAPLPPTVTLKVTNVPTSHLADVAEAIESALPDALKDIAA